MLRRLCARISAGQRKGVDIGAHSITVRPLAEDVLEWEAHRASDEHRERRGDYRVLVREYLIAKAATKVICLHDIDDLASGRVACDEDTMWLYYDPDSAFGWVVEATPEAYFEANGWRWFRGQYVPPADSNQYGLSPMRQRDALHDTLGFGLGIVCFLAMQILRRKAERDGTCESPSRPPEG